MNIDYPEHMLEAKKEYEKMEKEFKDKKLFELHINKTIYLDKECLKNFFDYWTYCSQGYEGDKDYNEFYNFYDFIITNRLEDEEVYIPCYILENYDNDNKIDTIELLYLKFLDYKNNKNIELS